MIRVINNNGYIYLNKYIYNKRNSKEKGEKIMKDQRNQRGITLVALVVTIVVLLILAGITIMYVMQGDSIFSTANKAKTETADKSAQELVAMAMWSVQTDLYDSTGKINTAIAGAQDDAAKATAANDAAKDIFDKDLGTNGTSSVTFTAVGTSGISVTKNSTVVIDGVTYYVNMDTTAETPKPLTVRKTPEA